MTSQLNRHACIESWFRKKKKKFYEEPIGKMWRLAVNKSIY